MASISRSLRKAFGITGDTRDSVTGIFRELAEDAFASVVETTMDYVGAFDIEHESSFRGGGGWFIFAREI
jgi:hypothetical protein